MAWRGWVGVIQARDMDSRDALPDVDAGRAFDAAGLASGPQALGGPARGDERDPRPRMIGGGWRMLPIHFGPWQAKPRCCSFRAIVHHHGPRPKRIQPLRHLVRREVGDAAGRVGHDEADAAPRDSARATDASSASVPPRIDRQRVTPAPARSRSAPWPSPRVARAPARVRRTSPQPASRTARALRTDPLERRVAPRRILHRRNVEQVVLFCRAQPGLVRRCHVRGPMGHGGRPDASPTARRRRRAPARYRRAAGAREAWETRRQLTGIAGCARFRCKGRGGSDAGRRSCGRPA